MNTLQQRARALGLCGLLVHWNEAEKLEGLEKLLGWEEQERARRSLEHRFKKARLGATKTIADFDWTWPRSIDRDLIEELGRLAWLADATNVVLVGQNGVGKTMIAKRCWSRILLPRCGEKLGIFTLNQYR